MVTKKQEAELRSLLLGYKGRSLISKVKHLIEINNDVVNMEEFPGKVALVKENMELRRRLVR